MLLYKHGGIIINKHDYLNELSDTDLKTLLDEFELQSKVNDWYDNDRENYIDVLIKTHKTTVTNMQETLDRKKRMKNLEPTEKIVEPLNIRFKNYLRALKS